MKIAVISINKYSIHLNYGAALHSYAFGRVLGKLGCDNYLFVDYKPEFIRSYSIKYPLLNFNHNRSVGKCAAFAFDFFNNLKKYKKFQRFFAQRCRFTDEQYGVATLEELGAMGFDVYVCESDVIWKVQSTSGFDRGYFLDFEAARAAKRIAYSPSLGRGAERHASTYRELLGDFDYISTRERQGAEFLSEVLGRDVEWVLDPTLLLTRDDYMEIATPPRREPKPYVLLYNCMSNSSAMVAQATRYAKDRGLELIEISVFAANKLRYAHRVITGAGVEQFLWYVANAEFVFTNGFHGACLSVVFGREFLLFQRDKSDYRMNNIVEALGVSGNFIKKEDENSQIDFASIGVDYEVVNGLLEGLRQKSLDYLSGALFSS